MPLTRGDEKENMKPTSITNQNARPFPLVDYHYHTATLGKITGRCVRTSKSFRDISRDYFDIEADHDFLSDTAVFVALIGAAIVPIVSSAFAVIDLWRTLPF
jgi:hypothetical protein